MKIFRRILALPCCLLLAISAQTPAQAQPEPDAHHHHEQGSAKLALDHGKKWASDAPLRNSMDALRMAFAERLPAIRKATLSTADYKALGEKTETEIGNMVAQCKLDPKADAMLHVVIADLLAGADLMTGKAKGKPGAGARKAVSALNNYGRYFDHPGWVALR